MENNLQNSPGANKKLHIVIPIIVVFAMLVVVGIIFAVNKRQKEIDQIGTEKGQPCTMEARVCPDGSTVGKDKNCQFKECPTEKSSDNSKYCTMEMKICPDGSGVGKDKNCQFLPCPGENSGQMDGNDRDEHGCIGSAGYQWCEERQKCLRSWEESCSTMK